MLNCEAQKVLETFFEEDDWVYNKVVSEDDDADTTLYNYGVSTDGVIRSIGCQFAIFENEVVSMAFYPVKIDEDRYAEISEFINRMNYIYFTYVIFKLDYDNHMLIAVWRHDITCETAFDEDLAERMVWGPALAFVDFGDDLFLIANGGVSGKDQFMTVKKRMEEAAEREDSDDDDDGHEDTQKPKPIKFVIKL